MVGGESSSGAVEERLRGPRSPTLRASCRLLPSASGAGPIDAQAASDAVPRAAEVDRSPSSTEREQARAKERAQAREGLPAIVTRLPERPGVYLFKDAEGRVIYVGKARRLRRRVQAYFRGKKLQGSYLRALSAQIRDVEVVQTRTEDEALILENTFIKKHKPRYNINLKDDKSYPFLKLSRHELYPRLHLTRERHQANGEYFGPYASVKDARDTLSVVRQYFQLRTSKMKLDGSRRFKPCLNHQLGRCLAPCRGDVAPQDYAANVQRVRLFLQGRDRTLLEQLKTEMQRHARGQRFEAAAHVRDQIRAVKRALARQQVVMPGQRIHQDVIGLARQGKHAGVYLHFVRGEYLLGGDFFVLPRTAGLSDAYLLRGFLLGFYSDAHALLPHEILLPSPCKEQELMRDFLNLQLEGAQRTSGASRAARATRARSASTDDAPRHIISSNAISSNAPSSAPSNAASGIPPAIAPPLREVEEVAIASVNPEAARTLQIVVPKRGHRHRLIRMADENASQRLKEHLARQPDDESLLQQLQQELRLRHTPQRIEAFDVSTIQGAHTVAAMVTFDQAQARRAGYRRYHLEQRKGQHDDFRAMDEVLTRRYQRALREKEPLPQLILIDGGKGQVHVAAHVLARLGIDLAQLDLIGLAKGRSLRRQGVPADDAEYVVKPHQPQPYALRRGSHTLHFLQRVRDEAHRFAITFHRRARKRQQLRSQLEQIPGLGPKRAALLLRHFGSLDAVRKASAADLATLPGISQHLAEQTRQALRLSSM